MSFTEHDLPPIFAPNTPKYDIPIEGEYITRKLNKSQLKLALELKGLNSDGGVEQLRLRATQSVIPLTEKVGNMMEGYVGKATRAAQILCERGFTDLSENLPDGTKLIMNGTSSKDPLTGVVILDNKANATRILSQCGDLKNEKS